MLLLRGEDVNPDIPDIGYGQTSLAWAVENGCVGMVGLLLEWRGANPDNSNKSNRIPLS